MEVKSSKVEVKSSRVEVKFSPSGSQVLETNVLVVGPTVDDRPPCDDAGRVLGTFVVTALALLVCGMF